MPNNLKNNKKRWYYAKITIFFSVISVLLLVSLTAFWLQRTIFNTERFTALTTEALLQESSRQSIGEIASNKILNNQPTLKMVLGDKLTEQVSGLLGTEYASKSLGKVARQAQLVFTSPAREPITFQLASIKAVLISVQNVANKTEQSLPGGLNASDIPDEIIIVDTSKIPNVHKISIIVGWLGPLSFIFAIAGLSLWVYRGGKKVYLKRLQIVSALLMVVALVALSVGPLAEPAVLASMKDASAQTLLGNIYRTFLHPFNEQAWWLFGSGVVILVITFVWEKFIKNYKVKLVVTKI